MRTSLECEALIRKKVTPDSNAETETQDAQQQIQEHRDIDHDCDKVTNHFHLLAPLTIKR
jgi:hypothetical protein